jgi:hypothetical protein
MGDLPALTALGLGEGRKYNQSASLAKEKAKN